MSEMLSYADALKILGAKDSRLASFLDTVASMSLTAWAAGTALSGGSAEVPLALYEIKNDVVSYARTVIRKVSEWHSGLSRFDRSQRLVAAHAVIVVSSFFEALDMSGLAIDLKSLKLTSKEQAALVTGGDAVDKYAAVIQSLLDEQIPVPEPHRTYEATRREIGFVYSRMALRLIAFLEGLAVVVSLSDADRALLQERISNSPEGALLRYDDAYRSLAVDNTEFAVWASLTETHAAGAGLERVTDLLTAMWTAMPGGRSLRHLVKSYHAALGEPVVTSGRAPEGLILPSLGEAYISPECQVSEIGPGDAPSSQVWWQGREIVADTEAFLAGYLTSPRATRAPLMVLGEPGSGKSKLTQVLAARLSDAEFLPIRVELRDVAAESTISAQIEQAILNDPGEHVTWHDLLQSANGALPVILLDGFDELLQASGLNRYDYLEQVQEFQRKQAAIDHPLAVIVTSRIVVADRARFPRESLGLRLLPFTDRQIVDWLEIWNRHNGATLAARNLSTLTSEVVLAHRELAEQPLLLLMLSIFDATANELQRSAKMGSAELYRALLMDFALREIRKSARNRALSDEQHKELAERELQRLAFVALGMFARGRKFVTENELNSDLPVLFPEREELGMRPTEQMAGRFFFIHRSEARSSGEKVRSYEFLHSTFEEFLLAWIAHRALLDLAALRAAVSAASTASSGRLDDGFLFNALSFRCLAERAATVTFLEQLLSAVSVTERSRCRSLIPALLVEALYTHPGRSHTDYEPVRDSFPRRVAAYSANLILLLILISDQPLHLYEIFGEDHPTERWHQHARLWKGFFFQEEWDGLLDAIRAEKQREEVVLLRGSAAPVSVAAHILDAPAPASWVDPTDYDVQVAPTSLAGIALKESTFLANWHEERILLDCVPFLKVSEGWLLGGAGNPIVAPLYLLAELDYSRDASPQQRAELYKLCFGAFAELRTPSMRKQLLLRLREDIRSLDPQVAYELILQAAPADPSDEDYLRLINELWRNGKAEDSRLKASQIAKDLSFKWPSYSFSALDVELRIASTMIRSRV
jgi:hypothetical protein